MEELPLGPSARESRSSGLMRWVNPWEPILMVMTVRQPPLRHFVLHVKASRNLPIKDILKDAFPAPHLEMLTYGNMT